MADYWMVRLGTQGAYSRPMVESGKAGVDFIGDVDLSDYVHLPVKAFHAEFNPRLAVKYPDKTRISIGLAIGNLWTFTTAIFEGDVIVTRIDDGTYAFGTVVGQYEFHPGQSLPHQRPVRWDTVRMTRDSFSDELKNSSGSLQTVFSLNAFADEIDQLRGSGAGVTTPQIETEEVAFRLERQLEDFLVENWAHTSLGKNFDIFEDEFDGETVSGRQFRTDIGVIDVLAISKDRAKLLVVELKRGQTSDDTMGQVLRYMGWVKAELASPGQAVEGVIIGLGHDQKLMYALSAVTGVSLMSYRVNFELLPV